MKNRSVYLLIFTLAVLVAWPFSASPQGIDISSGGSITIVGNATIELHNQGFINNGTYTKATESVIFSGNAAKVIMGSSNTEWYNLSITNTSGITTQLSLLTTQNLTIASGCKFTIDAGKAVTVSNTLTNNAGNGGLVIKSTSSSGTGTGFLDNASPGVNATVERYMSGDLWHLISPAATGGELVADFVGTTQNDNLISRNTVNYGLASYSESDDSWDYFKVSGSNTSGLFGIPGGGYQVLRASGSGTGEGNQSANGIVRFQGTLAAASQSVGIAQTGNGWNLIGNPYPCALDLNEFLLENAMEINPSYLAIYVSNIGDVSTYGYTPVNNSSNLKLAPGEGFFVKSASGINTISFTTTMKSMTSDDFKSGEPGYTVVSLSAVSGTEKRSTLVKYIPGMTKGLDPGWDAGSFNGGEATFSLTTRLVEDNGVDFNIQSLPDFDHVNMIVPIGLNAERGSKIIFSALVTNLPNSLKVYLEDKDTGIFSRLDIAGSTYTAIMNINSNGIGRFYLHTTTFDLEKPALMDIKVIPLPEQQIIRISGQVSLPAKVLVYDITGRLLIAQQLNDSDQNEIPWNGSENGIYLVRIDSKLTPYSQKIIWITR